MTAHVHIGNVLDVLPTLDAGSVHCCVTSPPSGADAMERLGGEPQAVALGDVLVGVRKVRHLPSRPVPVREVPIADDLRLVLRRIRLQAPPFSFPEPVELFPDASDDDGYLALWETKAL